MSGQGWHVGKRVGVFMVNDAEVFRKGCCYRSCFIGHLLVHIHREDWGSVCTWGKCRGYRLGFAGLGSIPIASLWFAEYCEGLSETLQGRVCCGGNYGLGVGIWGDDEEGLRGESGGEGWRKRGSIWVGYCVIAQVGNR